MAAKPLMTWDAKYRRWYKRYRKARYLVSCRELKVPPTKAESVAAANDWWAKKKAELDDQRKVPIPSTIKTLELERDWYEYAGDKNWLRRRLRRLPKLNVSSPRLANCPLGLRMEVKLRHRVTPETKHKWSERERTINRVRQDNIGEHVRDQIKDFLGGKEAEVKAGEIKPATLESLRHCLAPFEVWFGNKPLTHVSEATLDGYRRHLLDLIAKKEISRKTAAVRMNALKQFIKDRWRLRRVDMPRNFDDVGIAIKHTTPSPTPSPRRKQSWQRRSCSPAFAFTHSSASTAA